MLVLSRKVGQNIIIGEGIEVTIVELRGDQVRLGIEAPRDVPINRKEILGRIRSPERSPPADEAPSPACLACAPAPPESNGVSDGVSLLERSVPTNDAIDSISDDVLSVIPGGVVVIDGRGVRLPRLGP
jgi:carbon storage regulator